MSTAIKRRTSIRDLIDNLDKYLQQRNYSAKTLRLHCRPLWNKLANYAEANGHEMVDDTWVSNFLTGYWESTGKSMSSNTRRKYCRAAEMLYEYQQKGRIVRYTGWKREVQNASNYQPLYDAVEKYSARNRLCEDTKTACTRCGIVWPAICWLLERLCPSCQKCLGTAMPKVRRSI